MPNRLGERAKCQHRVLLFSEDFVKEFSPSDISVLKKRLQWQIDNHTRGLKIVKLDPAKLQ
jgi:hypothetical protein